MPIIPKISAVMRKKHQGDIAISLNGKVIAVGKNSIEALKRAKNKLHDIEDKEFLVSRIQPKYIAA